MIIICNAEYYEVDGDVGTIYSYDPHQMVRVNGNEAVYAQVLQEKVKGRRFRNPRDGTDVVVGLSKDVQELIGLQYEAWDNLEKAYEAANRNYNQIYHEVTAWRKKFDELENASVWRRILWVFKGLF